MTVSSEVNHNDYQGNGTTTVFPYQFRIFKKTDLVVTTSDLNDTLTTLRLDTDYTVTGAGGYNGGTVVLPSPLSSGWKISVARVLSITQETDLRNQGKFFAEVHENAFDKLTMLIQQGLRWIGLALCKPSTIANYYDAQGNYIRNLHDPVQPQDVATKNYVDNTVATSTAGWHAGDEVLDQKIDANFAHTLRVPESSINMLGSVSDRANKLLAFNSSGQPISVLPESGSATDVMIELAADDGASKIGGAFYADIRAYNAGGNQIKCLGRTNIFDGADGVFILDPSDVVSQDNDGTVLVDTNGGRWKRVFDGPLNGLWFGMDRGGAKSSGDAFNKILSVSGTFGQIFIPEGVYLLPGGHDVQEGKNILFDNVTLKSDGNAATTSLININADDVSIGGSLIIDGEVRDPGENPPRIAIGLRVGEQRQIERFNCAGVKSYGVVYGVFITGAKDSTIKNCLSYRNSDGFRLASVTSGVANSFGCDNVRIIDCISLENGMPYMPVTGTGSTGGYAGFKVTDIPISDIYFINCIARGNCGFGFNIHGHPFTSIPSGFEMKGLHFINCISDGNNIPEFNLPSGFVTGAGNCSGFYIGAVGVAIKNVFIDGCTIKGQSGEAIYFRALNDSGSNLNLIENILVSNCRIEGAPRSLNSSVRTSNSALYLTGTRNLLSQSNVITGVEYLYDFVYYINNSRSGVKIKDDQYDTSPNLIYAKSSKLGGVVGRIDISGIQARKGGKLNSATANVMIRVVDFEEIIIEGNSINDVSETQSSTLVNAILQQNTTTDSKSIKIINNSFSCANSSVRIGAPIEINSIGGSKLFSGNTITHSIVGISGNNTENAIIIANHFDAGTVATKILNFPASTIKKANIGLPDS
ncbi:hypothetical protein ABKE32_000499 [Escherichia albertii]